MTGGRNNASTSGRRVFASSQEQHGGKPSRPERNLSKRTSTRVYVGNLKFEVSWQDLKDHMKQAGRVLRADVMTDANGRSKGCGIVEFESAADAEQAIATLNDTDLNGRLIFVREDREQGSGAAVEGSSEQPRAERPPQRERPTQLREQRERPARDVGQAPPAGGQTRQSRSLYVGNLSWDVTWQDLKDHMRSLGGIVEHADVLTEPNGRSKGCGLVTFATVQDTENALNQLNNTELKGRPIFIREDREAGDGAGGVSNNRLYVGNLDYRTEWYELKDHFKTVGAVTRADVVKEEGSTRSKGYGIVEYSTAEDAAQAVETLNNSQLLGRPIFVRLDREEKKRY